MPTCAVACAVARADVKLMVMTHALCVRLLSALLVCADAKLMVMTHALYLARTVPEVATFVVDPGSSLMPDGR